MTLLDGCTASKEHLTSIAAPVQRDSLIEWDARPLGFKLTMNRRAPAHFDRLIEGLEWNCVMPAADAVFRFDDGTEIRGLGYAEVMEVHVAPWRLPIDELRWGRFVGPKASAVWIDWRGSHPLTMVLIDGVRANDAHVGDQLVEADGRLLEITENRSIRDLQLGETLGGIKVLRSVLPLRLMKAHETKWRALVTLKEHGATIDTGWAIHELVRLA